MPLFGRTLAHTINRADQVLVYRYLRDEPLRALCATFIAVRLQRLPRIPASSAIYYMLRCEPLWPLLRAFVKARWVWRQRYA